MVMQAMRDETGRNAITAGLTGAAIAMPTPACSTSPLDCPLFTAEPTIRNWTLPTANWEFEGVFVSWNAVIETPSRLT
eukprot:6572133-Alexandrium_andersonii.AAC.1